MMDGIVDSSMIAYFATRKNMTGEKAKIVHAFQVNQSMELGLLPVDPVCMRVNCMHDYSIHGKSWKDPNTGKRKSCRCKHAIGGMKK